MRHVRDTHYVSGLVYYVRFEAPNIRLCLATCANEFVGNEEHAVFGVKTLRVDSVDGVPRGSNDHPIAISDSVDDNGGSARDLVPASASPFDSNSLRR